MASPTRDTPSIEVDYNHARNGHTLTGPCKAFQQLWKNALPLSLLDVGCGTGTWLRAAIDSGVNDVVGVDGAQIPRESLQVPLAHFLWENLTTPIDLKRKFDAVLCLEVAEHLFIENADVLLDTLVRHSDLIVFAAACPGQLGQHHVNCQWPEWWQERFNKRGYRCEDEIRWKLWDDSDIEVWYRQNVFVAYKDPQGAYSEERIKPVIHPEMLPYLDRDVPSVADRNRTVNDSTRAERNMGTLTRAVISKAVRLANRIRSH